MQITLLGASGFIGRHLIAALTERGDTVRTGSLREGTAAAAAELCAGSDAVINLAGAPVAQRWTAAHMQAIRTSRVDRTLELLDELAKLPQATRPRAYIVSSAIGFYGTSPDATFIESSAPGTDFLAEICVALEREAARATTLGMRLAVLRIGIVLGPDGGTLAALLPIFKLGLGGPIAGGKQWCSWIHIDDMVRLFLFAIDGAAGVLNGTAPTPATNKQFTQAIGQALNRPAFLPTPGFASELALGKGAIIVNKGQRVLPERTLAQGFTFIHPTLKEAMKSLFPQPY